MGYQSRYDYVARTDGQPVYIGYALMTETVDDIDWILYKYAYDVNNQVTMISSSTVIP